MVTVAVPLQTLTQARAQKRPWLEVAGALLDLEGKSMAAPDGRPWIQIAAEQSGYTANQLRRMTRVVKFIHNLVQEGRIVNTEILSTMKFSHLEVAVKIAAFDPETTLKILKCEWIKPTYPSLLEVYHQLRETSPKGYVPMVAGKSFVRRFQDVALKILKSTISSDAKSTNSMGRMSHPSNYANPDFLLVSRANGRIERVDAFDCYALTGRTQRDGVMKRVIHVMAEATFFSNFWAILPDSENAHFFYEQSQLLGMYNVGVFAINMQEEKVVEKLLPRDDCPVPDRRNIWLARPPMQLP